MLNVRNYLFQKLELQENKNIILIDVDAKA